MSSQHTGHWTYALLTAIFGPIDQQRFEVFHFLLRKTGHFAGYGILSLLTFRAVRISFPLTLVRMCASSVAFSGVVAALDEWHQTYIPSRTGSVQDVMLDTFAAACTMAVVMVKTSSPQRTQRTQRKIRNQE
jgi:VanZ family protein